MHCLQNRVRNYETLQGYSHASDSHVNPVRDINHRYITLENGSDNSHIGVAVRTTTNGQHTTDFTLKPLEIKHLAINTHGDVPQYIYLIDPDTGKYRSQQTCIRRDANQLVLREGINNWFVQFFHRATYHP